MTLFFNELQLFGTRHDVAVLHLSKVGEPETFVLGRIRFPNDYSFQVVKENGSFTADDIISITFNPLKRLLDKPSDKLLVLGSTIDSTPPNRASDSGSTIATKHQTTREGTFTLTRVRIYSREAANLHIAIYDDSSGPNTILGETDVVTSPNGGNEGIQEFDFPDTEVINGTFYWIVVSGGAALYYYNDDVDLIISDGFAEPLNIITSGGLGMVPVGFYEHESTPGAFAYGGTDGQVLTKQSSTDYDVAWEDPGGSGLTQSQLMARLSIGF